MFNSMINCQVEVIVSSHAETILEYIGILVEDDNNFIKLKNVTINYAMLNFQKSIFGGNINSYRNNIKEVILNKNYIISCNMIK